MTKKLTITLIIAFTLQFITFLMPVLTQQLYDDSTGHVWDGIVFYGHQDFLYYVNAFILLLFTFIIILVRWFNKYILIVLFSIYGLAYTIIMNFTTSSTFGNTPIGSRVEIGTRINLATTYAIFILLFLICSNKKKKIFSNDDLLDS